MSEALSILSVGAGTLLAIIVFTVVVVWFIQDVTQKKHAVLRNYPVIGRLRYFFEKQGEYFRQYFFAGDREEMPFNRATRALDLPRRQEEDGGGLIGFGSTNDMKRAGLDPLRQCALPGAGVGAAAHAAARDRRGLVRAALHRAIPRQHQRHELRRDLGARGAVALARRGGRPAAGSIPAKAACRRTTSRAARHHHADRHRASTASATTTATSRRSAREELGAAREGVRDQALAGREARQGRRAARRRR